MKEETKRNYRVVGLLAQADHYTVECQLIGAADSDFPSAGDPYDSGISAASFGDFGLDRAERAILSRGITATGADKNPHGRTRRRKKK